ncbi:MULTISPECIES: nuclear transport factor 2 family protein [unclassified Beijerinckia]|uniref:nuclear transport factor 2 family protein n=1 Tax=unclassified Beijerinckia TaxID=2638183 RepID=UPI00089D2630|nr:MULTISPECIES: nuclear transport factor 2 family protein [unclassified Beijerinckia]MDH7795038.1 ketosteroid isomerase-like protein [Beijerinckia sp. GAS462]SEB85068.1 hypothetical protein SAMN05443249_1309 [Beijerinckia sp. 28-YEA-48]
MTRYACALLITSTFVVVAAPAQAQDADATARNAAIVRQAFDSWVKGGNVFAKLLAPDVTWTIHGSGPVARTYIGLKDFVERASAPLITRLATPLVPEVHDIWAVGDTVIIRFDASATTTSGAPYANQFVWIFRMTNGVVSEAQAFLDLVAYQKVVDNNAPRAD